MRRREFITVIGGAAFLPARTAFAQADRMRRIGVLMTLLESDPEAQLRLEAIKKALQEQGWNEGRNVRIDFRWAGGDRNRAEAYAAELVGLQPDVILVGGGAIVEAARRATRTIPIVFAQIPDPVAAGYVASLARPGGNITGFALYEEEIAVKWLELLKQIAPRIERAAMIYDPANPAWARYLRRIEAAAPSFGVKVSSLAVHDATEIQHGLESFASEPNWGLIVIGSPLTAVRRDLIVELAARHRLPAVYPYRYFVTSGGLASYGVDVVDLYRRAALYADRILKGEKPADLPVQFADKFELVINLKTAKALGLEIPVSVLARTDEVIE
jgi:putative ABC transport system substrate-binding protein